MELSNNVQCTMEHKSQCAVYIELSKNVQCTRNLVTMYNVNGMYNAMYNVHRSK